VRVREALGDDLAGVVGAVQAVGEHELERAGFGVLERLLRHHAPASRDADVLEHVEGRVEGAVAGVGPAPHVAVPAAVVELGAQHGLGQPGEARVSVHEVGAEPEPEAEVAEVDPFQEEGAVHGLAGGHEPAQQAVGVRAGVGVILREPARHQEQEAPGDVGPASLRPVALRAPMLEHLSDPAGVGHSSPLRLPHLGWLVEQVA
jgi:hypothetical protein